MEIEIAKLGKDVKHLEHEIEEIKQSATKQDVLTEKNVETNKSIAILNEQMKNIASEVKSINARLKRFEEQPRRYIDAIITALISGIVGYLLAYFLR